MSHRKVNFSQIISDLTGKTYDAWRQYCYTKNKEPKDIDFIREYIKSDGNVVDKNIICARLDKIQLRLIANDNLGALMDTKKLIDDIST